MVDDTPTDPTMMAPLNSAPRAASDTGTGTRRMNYADRPGVDKRRRISDDRPARYEDMLIPRIWIEPDEKMDQLRARALRVAIVRDVVLIVLGLYLLGSWVILPMWRALGG
jgi:hypothetical protein